MYDYDSFEEEEVPSSPLHSFGPFEPSSPMSSLPLHSKDGIEPLFSMPTATSFGLFVQLAPPARHYRPVRRCRMSGRPQRRSLTPKRPKALKLHESTTPKRPREKKSSTPVRPRFLTPPVASVHKTPPRPRKQRQCRIAQELFPDA